MKAKENVLINMRQRLERIIRLFLFTLSIVVGVILAQASPEGHASDITVFKGLPKSRYVSVSQIDQSYRDVDDIPNLSKIQISRSAVIKSIKSYLCLLKNHLRPMTIYPNIRRIKSSASSG